MVARRVIGLGAVLAIVAMAWGCGGREKPKPQQSQTTKQVEPAPVTKAATEPAAKEVAHAAPPLAPVKADEPPKAKEADPVESLKTLLARLEKEGIGEKVNRVPRSGKWRKVQALPIAFRYDVVKTTSLVSPFQAKVLWGINGYATEEFASESDAAKSTIPTKPGDTVADGYWAELAFQDNRWVVTDVGYGTPGDAIDFRHSKKSLSYDLNDWWRAFGGKSSE